MKNKILSLLSLSILSLIMLIGIASAVSLKDVTEFTYPKNTTHNGVSFPVSFNLTNSGTAGNLDFSKSQITSGIATISFDDTAIADGSSEDIKETITATISFDAYQSGNIMGIINVTGEGMSTYKGFTFSVPIISSPSITVSSSTISPETNSTTITVKNTGNKDLNNIVLSASGDFNVALSPSTISSLSVGSSSQITATRSNLNLGENHVTILVNASDGTYNSGTITAIKSFCEEGAVNDSNLRLNVDISNKGDGEDEEWLPLDTIEIEVELENNINNVDLNDVIFELGLYKKSSTKNIAKEMIWISEDDNEIKFGDIDEDDEGLHKFEFRVDPKEIDDGDYILMVKAYPNKDEDEYCIDYSDDLEDFGNSMYTAEIEIIKESDDEKMVIIDTKKFPTPIQISCSQQVTLYADVHNIGDEDFQDQIMVSLYNKELGINLKEISTGDLDSGESTEVAFVFEIPSNAEEKQYTLEMRTFYDYDEDDNEYKEVSKDTFFAYLKVKDNCIRDSTAFITANLISEKVVAGEELIIQTTITNTGDQTNTYTVNVDGHSSWTSSAKLDSQVLVLKSGESKDTTMTFEIKKDVSGEKTLNIQVVGEGEKIYTQTVSVHIEGVESRGITGFNVASLLDNQNYLWVIIALNIILAVIIVIVAVKIVKRKQI